MFYRLHYSLFLLSDNVHQLWKSRIKIIASVYNIKCQPFCGVYRSLKVLALLHIFEPDAYNRVSPVKYLPNSLIF